MADMAPKFQCTICNSSFSTKFNFKAHENRIHKGIKFECHEWGCLSLVLIDFKSTCGKS